MVQRWPSSQEAHFISGPLLRAARADTRINEASLALADGDLGPVLIRAIPEFRAGSWQFVSWRPLELKKSLRKNIISGLMSYRNGEDGGARTARIVAKAYGSDRGSMALTANQRLWEGGFRPPARYRVPRPYGYAPEHGTLVQGLALGTRWSDFLGQEERALVSASSRAAGWLIRLQGSSVEAHVRQDDTAVSDLALELVARIPSCAPRLEPVVDRLFARLRQGGVPLLASHGDFHPKNVFLTDRVATVIDFDTFGLREAAFDVGYAIGQLLIWSDYRLRDLARGARAAGALWHRYESGGDAAWSRVAVQVARTFLQSLHYELCTLENERVDLLERWPRLMEEWLDSEGPQTLGELGRSRGPIR